MAGLHPDQSFWKKCVLSLHWKIALLPFLSSYLTPRLWFSKCLMQQEAFQAKVLNRDLSQPLWNL